MAISFHVWLKNVESIVEAFSDDDFQKMAWSGSLPTSLGSPDEMVSVYFDDAMVPDFLSTYAGSLGDATVTTGRRLSELLESFDWPSEDGFIDWKKLLARSDWSLVISVARSFLECLRREMDSGSGSLSD